MRPAIILLEYTVPPRVLIQQNVLSPELPYMDPEILYSKMKSKNQEHKTEKILPHLMPRSSTSS